MKRDDVAALHFVGARVSQQPSNALPSECYGDPARHIQFQSEKCAQCKYERIIRAGPNVGIGVCQKKNQDGSKRLYGKRCDDYRKVGTK